MNDELVTNNSFVQSEQIVHDSDLELIFKENSFQTHKWKL